jgi:hypothetical protein
VLSVHDDLWKIFLEHMFIIPEWLNRISSRMSMQSSKSICLCGELQATQASAWQNYLIRSESIE